MTAALGDLGVNAQATIGFADEMRLGLHSQLRRRWCPRGVQLVQPQQMRFEWQWLALSVDVVAGHLLWRWQKNLRAPSVRACGGGVLLRKGRLRTGVGQRARAPGQRCERGRPGAVLSAAVFARVEPG